LDVDIQASYLASNMLAHSLRATWSDTSIPTALTPEGNLKFTRSSPVARAKRSHRTRLIDGRHPESVRFSALIDAFALVTLDDIRDEPIQLHCSAAGTFCKSTPGTRSVSGNRKSTVNTTRLLAGNCILALLPHAFPRMYSVTERIPNPPLGCNRPFPV
jgi:hypothetical protein